MTKLLATLILLSAPLRAQVPGIPLPFGRTSTGRAAYLAKPPAQTGTRRLAWAVSGQSKDQPELKFFSFMLSRMAFSLSPSPDRWPAICDQFWTWNDAARRFQAITTSSASASGTPQCTFRGTVYFKGFLIPRCDFRPEVSVCVEGAQGSLPIPVRMMFDDRRSSDWSGYPVFIGEISTTMLADGPQRLRVEGGYREYRIDGDPATPELEDGGDAHATFLVDNHPAP